MATVSLTGTYRHHKNENYNDFLKALSKFSQLSIILLRITLGILVAKISKGVNNEAIALLVQ